MKPAAPRYSFGPYVLDRARGLFLDQGAPVVLTPRVFELLATFVEHAGEALSKDELFKGVWGSTIVEENNLARQVSTLRKLLRERPGHHDYIATVPGVGYRFVAPVAVWPPSAEAPAFADQPPRSSRVGTYIPLALGVTALVIGVVMVLMARGTWHVPSMTVQRSLSQFTYGSGLQEDPAWSPTGDRLAYASDRLGNSDIWVQGVSDVEPVRVTSSPARDWQPAWSPDGRWLVFRSERDGGGLYLVPAAGGPEERLATFGFLPRWSPSGQLILFTNASSDSAGAVRAYVVGRNGGVPRAVQSEALTNVSTVSTAWHPDGRVSVWGRDQTNHFVFITTSIDGSAAVRSTMRPDVRERLDTGEVTLSRFVWPPSGRYLYFEGRSQSVRNLWRVTLDPRTLEGIDGPERLTTGPGTDSALAVSPDGSRLAFTVTSGQANIWAFDFDPINAKIKGPGEAVTSGESEESGVDAWMDGQKVIYLASRNNRQEVWERLWNNRPRLLLSATGWHHTSPRWSPDGTRVAYQRSRRGNAADETERAVAILAVDVQREHLLTQPGERVLVPADWSADAMSLLSACKLRPPDPLGTCILPIASGNPAPRRVSSDGRVDMVQQRFSPNQKWISFSAIPIADRSIATVYVMPASGGHWTPITDGAWYDDKPRWAPDGRTIYFISNRDGRSDVWGRRLDPATGQPLGTLFRVTSFEGGRRTLSPYVGQMDMSVSTKRIFLPMYDATGQIWILDRVDR